ncbi:hypothetical protein AB0M43_33075 [Longispora sp. NPDC051575]|uniref:hypothetical protein n=1 Tax=Longispora sp. NPDC051575 TaxID=3154943 RepID=UPI00344564E9
MPDPQAVSSAADLKRELAALRERAGAPSFNKLAGKMGTSPSTIHDLITKVDSFPRWETVALYLEAVNEDPKIWRQAWMRANRSRPPQTSTRRRPQRATEDGPITQHDGSFVNKDAVKGGHFSYVGTAANPEEQRLRNAAQFLHDQAIRFQQSGNSALAESFFLESAKAGHPCAPHHLARIYLASNQITRAIQWYRYSADAGDYHAMHNLGVLLAQIGQREEAAEWISRAKEAGHTCRDDHLSAHRVTSQILDGSLKEDH